MRGNEQRSRGDERQPSSPGRGILGRRRWLAVLAIVALLAAAAFVAVSATSSSRPDRPASATTYTVFGDTVPSTASVADGKPVELGLRFTTRSDGWATSVRLYQGPENHDEHEGALWGPSGELLGRSHFPASDETGWRAAPLDAPVHLSSGTTYTVSYTAPEGHYAVDGPTFSPAPTDGSPLTAVQGVYTYGSGLPTQNSHGTYYFVDVVFTTTTPPAAPPSAVTSTATATTATATSHPSSTPTAAPASDAARPGPSTTGVPSGTTLTAYDGPHVITVPGTVIDAKDVRGGLTIRARGVVITRSAIHDDARAVAGVYVEGDGSVTVSDSEIYDVQVGIGYDNWSASRVDIHDTTSDGVKIGSHVRLDDSWIHDGRPDEGAHWDGGQVQSGISDARIEGNYIDADGPATNSALFLAPDLGPSSAGPLAVTGNWLSGGNYTLYVLDGADGTYVISGISVADNRFGRSSRYGPADITVPVSWSGNVWDDTGQDVSR